MKIPIVSIKFTFMDWPSPDDFSVIVYIAGCDHKCNGCQSPDLQNASEFPESDIEYVMEIIKKEANENLTKNIVLSGGDPLFHRSEVQFMIDTMKKEGYKFCIYTGYDFERASKLIHGYDFIKTGKYDCNNRQTPGKTDDRMILASTNQEFHDVNGKLLTKNGVLEFRKHF